MLPGSLIVETFSTIIILGCIVSYSSCHQRCQSVSLLSITSSLCLLTWTLSSLSSPLLYSFMSLSSGKSITCVPPSQTPHHFYLSPNKSNCSEGTPKRFSSSVSERKGGTFETGSMNDANTVIYTGYHVYYNSLAHIHICNYLLYHNIIPTYFGLKRTF